MKIIIKLIIGCALLMLGTKSWSQKKDWPEVLISLPDVYTLEVPTVDISTARLLDTTTLSVTYNFTYQIDPKAPQKSTYTTLDVGKSYVKYSFESYFISDSLGTYNSENLIPLRPCDHIPCEEVLYKNKSSEMTVYNRIANSPTPLVSYEEKIPQIDWQVSDTETKTIAGYTCYSAKGVYGGREWIVWFAPDIPVPHGPWKLTGLPGIILRAEEASGCYRFETIGISTRSKPMLTYGCKILIIEKAKWRQLDKKMYTSPLEAMAKDEDTWIYYKTQRLDETWTIPYNPIELE